MPTLTLSGNCGVATATITYSGQASGSVTAASDGSFVISGLAAGWYTITPSKTGSTFLPANQILNVTTNTIMQTGFVASGTNMVKNNLYVQDVFTGGSLNAGWSQWLPNSGNPLPTVGGSGPYYISPNGTSAGCGMYWTGGTLPADQIMEVTVKSFTSNGNNAQALQILVRASLGPDSVHLQGYQLQCTSGGLQILWIQNGSGTVIAGTVAYTPSAGDVITLTACGTVIAAYVNGVRKAYILDTRFANGVPGIYLTTNSGSASSCEVSSIRMSTIHQQDGVWTKMGCVLQGTSAEMAGAGISGFGSVLYGPAKFLSVPNYPNVYGTYYNSGASNNSCCYAESADGVNWYRYSGNPVVSPGSDTDVYFDGTTYYWLNQAVQGSGYAHYLTSTDGLNFTDHGATNMPAASPGGYALGICAIIGTTMYALAGALNGTGGSPNTYLYTASTSTPLVWSIANSGNPVMPGAFGSVVTKIGSTYYTWATVNDPGQAISGNNFDPVSSARWKSPDLINWTQDTISIQPALPTDSLNSCLFAASTGVGGVAGSVCITVGNQTFMYYQGSPGDSTGPQNYQSMLAIAPTPLASLITQPETGRVPTATDTFQRAAGGLGSNWTAIGTGAGGFGTLQISGSNTVEANAINTECASLYTGATFGVNQYSSFTIGTMSGSVNTIQENAIVLGQLGSGGVNWYALRLNAPTGGSSGTSLVLQKRVNGTATSLVTPECNINVGDVFTLQSNMGPDGYIVLTVFHNDYQLVQYTDYNNTFTSGYPGIYSWSSSAVAHAQISAFSAGVPSTLPTSTSLSLGSFWLNGVPATITNSSGHALTPTGLALLGQSNNPVTICFTDPSGNEYSTTGTAGSQVAAPIPVVLCDHTGHPIAPPFTLSNILTVNSASTGNRLNEPTPVMLVTSTGTELLCSGAIGSFIFAPTPIVLCDQNGNAITLP